MSNVFANKRSILHKGDGLVHPAIAPDVCKTPSPGGPVPVRYPNLAKDGDLADGTTTVKIEGKSIAHKKANLSMSSGDEAGSAGGGIVSSKIKGKMTWTSGSPNVKFEGSSVVRFLDPSMHNGNNSNTGGTDQGQPGAPTVEQQKQDALGKGHRKGKSASKRGKHQKGDKRRLQKFNDKKRNKPGWRTK